MEVTLVMKKLQHVAILLEHSNVIVTVVLKKTVEIVSISMSAYPILAQLMHLVII